MTLMPHSRAKCHAHALLCMVLVLITSACGTGIEVTEHVTDKDVRRVMEKNGADRPTVTLPPFEDPLTSWREGKRFWVTDDQVRELMLNQQDCNLDSVHLAGHVLSFLGSEATPLFADDDHRIDIRFEDVADGRCYVYRFGLAQHADRSFLNLPMLVDMDLVSHVARHVQSKDYYIRTSIWYDRDNEQMMAGRHFIKVHIDSVLPGNNVLPLKVFFTAIDSGEKAMVWMSDNASTMHGRDFDALFVASDPHLSYPLIGDDNWQMITRGQVAAGMTKEECLLSLGTPGSIVERPDQAGLREYWYYDGGSYLYFVDGLLSQFRR